VVDFSKNTGSKAYPLDRLRIILAEERGVGKIFNPKR
jgi:hypothetical protein